MKAIRTEVRAWVKEHIEELDTVDTDVVASAAQKAFAKDQAFVDRFFAEAFHAWTVDIIGDLLRDERTSVRKDLQRSLRVDRLRQDLLGDDIDIALWREKTRDGKGFMRLLDMDKKQVVILALEYEERAHPLMRRSALLKEIASGMKDGQHVRDVYDIEAIGDIEARLQIKWSHGLLGKIAAEVAA